MKRDPNKVRTRAGVGALDVYSDERGTIGHVHKLKDGRWAWRLVYGPGRGHAPTRAHAIKTLLAWTSDTGFDAEGYCRTWPCSFKHAHRPDRYPPGPTMITDEELRARREGRPWPPADGGVHLTRDEVLTLRMYIAQLEDPQRVRDAAFWARWKENPVWGKLARGFSELSAPTKDWIISIREVSDKRTLQQLVFDHDEYGDDVVMVRDLRFGSEGRAVVTRAETGAKEMLEACRGPHVQAGHAPDCAGCHAPGGSGVAHTYACGHAECPNSQGLCRRD